MGSGHWSATTYHDRAGERARSGKDTFGYSEHAKRTGQKRAHQSLDPFNLRLRESRDSQEHPNSNAIIISLDVTGSMGMVVRAIHQNLPKLHELLLGHHYIPHPQIMFAAVGDGTCDHVPLQVGQFESDNRMDQNLENMFLEGGGGTGKTESYELMLYLAARHTAIDCWQKRQHKGHLFMIGDEMAYPEVKKDEINRIIGGGLQTDLPLANAIEEARKMYEIYFVIPGGASHGADQDVLQFWQHYLGVGRVIQLEEPQDTSQCIGLAIGMNEGRVTLNDAVADLRKHGVASETIDRVARALLWLPRGGATVQSTGPRRL